MNLISFLVAFGIRSNFLFISQDAVVRILFKRTLFRNGFRFKFLAYREITDADLSTFIRVS